MIIENVKELLVNGESDEFRKMVRLAYDVAEAVKAKGGRALIVGGSVRDILLKKENPAHRLKDIDVEIFGIQKNTLRSIIARFGKPIEVGASFAVFKVGGLDISMPRKDSKVSLGHKGFKVSADPRLEYHQAARRRSYTINSMGLDPLSRELLDPYGGADDLEQRILRAVDPDTFIEDSLRVLRGMQFVGRLGLKIEPRTLELCRSIDLSDLSDERIGEEWMKLLLLSEKPSRGLQAAVDMGILEKLHPELYRLVGLKQQEDWHPEGDVWEHTKLTVDAMAGISRREEFKDENAEILMLAALLHDVGKAVTTELSDGEIHSYNHHLEGLDLSKDFLRKIKRGRKVINTMLPLIKDHLFLTFNPEPSEKSIRRLSVRLRPATIRQLAYLIEADLLGMMAGEERFARCQRLLEKARELELVESMPEPLLTGKTLISKGLQPGPVFGEILDEAYDAQLNGEFSTYDGALAWFDRYLSLKK